MGGLVSATIQLEMMRKGNLVARHPHHSPSTVKLLIPLAQRVDEGVVQVALILISFIQGIEDFVSTISEAYQLPLKVCRLLRGSDHTVLWCWSFQAIICVHCMSILEQ